MTKQVQRRLRIWHERLNYWNWPINHSQSISCQLLLKKQISIFCLKNQEEHFFVTYMGEIDPSYKTRRGWCQWWTVSIWQKYRNCSWDLTRVVLRMQLKIILNRSTVIQQSLTRYKIFLPFGTDIYKWSVKGSNMRFLCFLFPHEVPARTHLIKFPINQQLNLSTVIWTMDKKYSTFILQATHPLQLF